MRKYWFYYLKNDNNIASLYAYTDNKKIAKLFESKRKMSIFIKEKRTLSNEDINTLASSNQGDILVLCTLNIYDKSNKKYFNVNFPLTVSEKIGFTNFQAYLNTVGLWKNLDFPSNIFLKEIKKALKLLYWDYLYDFINTGKSDYKRIEKLSSDELGILIHLYGKTIERI